MRPAFHSAAGHDAPADRESGAPSSADRYSTAADKARLARAFEQNAVFIWRSLRRLGVPRESADDATQQVFLVAARRMNEIVEGKERAFLFQSAMRVAMGVRREIVTARGRTDAHENALLEQADAALRPDDALDQSRTLRLLGQVLETMPIERRAVFVLYELEGVTVAEIASLLQIPMGTVASRLRCARDDFRAAIGRLERPKPMLGGDQ